MFGCTSIDHFPDYRDLGIAIQITTVAMISLVYLTWLNIDLTRVESTAEEAIHKSCL